MINKIIILNIKNEIRLSKKNLKERIMKNDLNKTEAEFKLEVYSELRKKIKTVIENDNFSDKVCIDIIWEALMFLSAFSE